MLSTEIAVLTEKEHKNVIRDIEVIIEQLEKDGSNLSSGFKSTTYRAGNGKNERCFELDYDSTMIVLTGYNVVARAKVIKRWQELENQKPLSQLEILAQSALALVEQERRLLATEQHVTALETKIESIEVDLRNGVPHGYISKSNAYKQYSKGLSRAIFELVMLHYDVLTSKYVHSENGHSTLTFAYKEDEIETPIADFISSSQQVSATMNADAIKDRLKEYRIKNAKKLAEEKKCYYFLKRDHFLKYAKENQVKNKVHIKEYKRRYGIKNKEAIIEKRKIRYLKNKQKNNPTEVIKLRVRSVTRCAFTRKGYTKKSKTHEILRCSFVELKTYLENQFKDGMNWDNRSKWEIDHIIPLSSAKTEDELIKLGHYTNLRPLWKEENQSKRDKMPDKHLQNTVKTRYAFAHKAKLNQISMFDGE